MRAMAVRPDGESRRLVEFKAVDGVYPLYGGLALEGGGTLPAALERRDGVWGAAAERGLFERLGLELGDLVRIGDASLRLAAVIEKEPDRGTQALKRCNHDEIATPRVQLGNRAHLIGRRNNIERLV